MYSPLLPYPDQPGEEVQIDGHVYHCSECGFSEALADGTDCRYCEACKIPVEHTQCSNCHGYDYCFEGCDSPYHTPVQS